ncbi:hypothetical protein HJB77_13990 [Rhizobium lentis]|nr:hypothetical protein [Rhizobium lentis]
MSRPLVDGAHAFYVPAYDVVQVPPPRAHFDRINWHRTPLHELRGASG